MKQIALFGLIIIIAICFFGCSETEQKSTSNSAAPLSSNVEIETEEKTDEDETGPIFSAGDETAGDRFLEAHSGIPVVEKTEIRDFDLNADGAIEWAGIQDAKTAGIIASAILEQYQSQGFFTTFKLFSVEHDKDAGIWVAGFWEDNDFPGASLSIAIREKTAEIIGVWIGE